MPPMNDRQRASQPLTGVIALERESPPGFRRLTSSRQRRLRQDRHARRNLDRALDVLDVVELEHDLNLNIMTPQEAVDRSPDRQIGIKRDERLAVQLADRDARSPGERDATDEPPAPSPPRAR